MTEDEWNACRDPHAMWMALPEDPFRSDLNLFGCACCRRVLDLVSDERLQRGIEVRERYERGLVSEDELNEVETGAGIARRDIRAPFKRADCTCSEYAAEMAPVWAAGAIANAAVGNYRAASEAAARARACAEGGDWQKSYEAERAAQCDLLRSMIAYPASS